MNVLFLFNRNGLLAVVRLRVDVNLFVPLSNLWLAEVQVVSAVNSSVENVTVASLNLQFLVESEFERIVLAVEVNPMGLFGSFFI